MTGVGLIILILAVIGILCGLYFAAWCLCSVQRSNKEGHYILDSDDELHDVYDKKLYSGLDMVDEAKEPTYVKNRLDLDSIHENTTKTVETTTTEDDGKTVTYVIKTTTVTEEVTPSAPGEDSRSGSEKDVPPV